MHYSKDRGWKMGAGLAALGWMSVGQVYGASPAPKWYDALSLSGYIQGSYVNNLVSPTPRTNVGRAFDVESNSFNLNAFHLQVAKPVGDDHYGFTTKLHTSRDARVIKAAGTSGATDFDVEEAYVTYVLPTMTQLAFTGGKFVTNEGVEVTENPLNPNFSNGFLYLLAEPASNTGVKITYTFNDKVNATFGVVNGWDTEADANDGKTVIWQIAATPIKMFSWGVEGSYGPEALSDNQSKRNSVDTVAQVMATDKLTLWFQGNWGQDSNVTPLAPTAPGNSTVHWGGLGAWAQYAFSPFYSEALRFEVFSDQNGAARLTAPIANAGPAMNSTLKEITWTHKFQWTPAVATRIEYRHDWANAGVFNLHEPGRMGTVQNTISADWVVSF